MLRRSIGQRKDLRDISDRSILMSAARADERSGSKVARRRTALLYGALLLWATTGSAAEAQIRLTVGYVTIASGSGALWVARELGIFEKNGLNVELVYLPSSISNQAIMTGQTPIAQTGGGLILEPVLRGADLVMLGSLRSTSAISFLVTRPDITNPLELKGKKLGVSRLGGGSHSIFEIALRKLGMNPKEATFLQIGNSAVRIAALKSGTIDGTLVTAEEAFNAKGLGLQVLLDLQGLGIEYLTTDMISTRRFVKEQEDTTRRFVKSMIEATHYFKTHRQKSIEVMARYMKLGSSGVVEAAYDSISEAYLRKPYVPIQGLQTMIDETAVRNPKLKDVKRDIFFDARFVKELDQSGFIDNLYGK
jgi:NitT/TauT family transport system substrate-binding protein